MSYKGDLVVREEALLATTFSAAMARVYQWMAAGLGVTAVAAMLVAQSEGIVAAVFGSPWTMMGLFGAQMVLVMTISGRIHSLAPATALGLFFLYSALMGVSLSTVFLVFDLGTIGVAFVATASTFGAMTIVGLTTKKDLTGAGPLFMMALIGLIVAIVANTFLQSSALGWLVSLVGVAVFMGLTAHDAQAIKTMTAQTLAEGDEMVAARVGVLGALSLYLDFLNLFLQILNLLGDGADGGGGE
ncbi:MAG: Bax inhibitor-1/YccA family protein [Chloroflexi bacterium]|nr:Bax inhibitor-1/YccA family protein [Chloroflexota bacterium]